MNKLFYFFIVIILYIFQINASEPELVSEVEVVTEVVTQVVEPTITVATENIVKNVNAEELKEFIEKNEIVVVGYLNDLNSKEYYYIQGLANSFKNEDHLNFLITTDPNSNIWTSEKINTEINSPGVVLFKQGNGYPVPFDKMYTTGKYNLRDLCLKALNPYVDELESTVKDFNYDYLLYFYADEEDKLAKIDLMQQLAVSLFQEFHVKYINLDRNPLNINYPELRSKFIIVSKSIQAFYRQSAVLTDEYAINFENISYFVNSYKSSLIDPEILWRLEEMNWEFTNYVTEIRPNIYESIVLNKDTDVLVLYYKSDCPYSQQVMKTFQDLAKRYINQRHKLTVAQFEAENQNIPDFSPWRNLVEYPTIVLYPASKPYKKRLYYVMKNNLGRSAINIANWFLKRATNTYEEVLYSPTDFENLNTIDGGYIVQDPKEEEEEFKTNKLLAEPNLIYTIFGEGKDQKYYSIEKEENNYYIGNTAYAELPMTGAYFELTPSTYLVHFPKPTNTPN